MPWTVEDVDRHMKELSASEKETWVEVANKALAACEKAGRTDCDASAIKQANVVIGKLREVLTGEENAFAEQSSQSEPAPGTVGASEATGDPLGSIEEFREDGELVEEEA